MLLSTYVAADSSYPPCRYNCPDTEKLICAILNGENRTFANKCQMELFSCITRASKFFDNRKTLSYCVFLKEVEN